MKIHKITIAISIVMSITSFFIGFHFYYIYPNSFFENISIGFMASSLVVLITSIVNYEVCKEESVQDFYIELLSFIDQIKDYPYSLGEKEKISWLYSMKDVNFVSFTHAYKRLSFIHETDGVVALNCFRRSYLLLAPIFENKMILKKFIDGDKGYDLAKEIMIQFENEIMHTSTGKSLGGGKLTEDGIKLFRDTLSKSEEGKGMTSEEFEETLAELVKGFGISAEYKTLSISFCYNIKNEMLNFYGKLLEKTIPLSEKKKISY